MILSISHQIAKYSLIFKILDSFDIGYFENWSIFGNLAAIWIMIIFFFNAFYRITHVIVACAAGGHLGTPGPGGLLMGRNGRKLNYWPIHEGKHPVSLIHYYLSKH